MNMIMINRLGLSIIGHTTSPVYIPLHLFFFFLPQPLFPLPPLHLQLPCSNHYPSFSEREPSLTPSSPKSKPTTTRSRPNETASALGAAPSSSQPVQPKKRVGGQTRNTHLDDSMRPWIVEDQDAWVVDGFKGHRNFRAHPVSLLPMLGRSLNTFLSTRG